MAEPFQITFLFVAVLAVVVIVSIVLVTKKSAPRRQQVRAPAFVKPAPVEAAPVATIYEDQVKDVDVHDAFPSMKGADVEEQLAQSYTYENLQDALLNSGVHAREAVKSRAAWSRFGNRANTDAWQQNMNVIKEEITKSGQTFETFMENAWMPIPEQMAAMWKENEASSAEPSAPLTQKVPKHAQSEAASLVRDATQDIQSLNALESMREVLAARKRAKTLGLKVPPPSKEQLGAIRDYVTSSDSLLAGTARALESIFA